jgi:hypothetical protein
MSIAKQILDLLSVAGLSVDERRQTQPDGSVAVSYGIPFPVRAIKYHRDSSGLITIDVPTNQCLVVTMIEAFQVDFSAPSTLAVKNSSDTLAQTAQPLQTIIGVPELYVFGPGKALFTFLFTALPTLTARVQVRGFRLPNEALNPLRLIATEQKAQ